MSTCNIKIKTFYNNRSLCFYYRYWNKCKRSESTLATDSKRLRGYLINTLAALIDESLILLRVTSGMVTDANNNVSEDRKIGLDTLRSPTLEIASTYTRNEFLLNPPHDDGHNVSGSSPNDRVSLPFTAFFGFFSFYPHFYCYHTFAYLLFILFYIVFCIRISISFDEENNRFKFSSL